MSNSMTVVPTNLPNVAGNIGVSSVGTTSPSLKVVWTRPSDFNEWSGNFNIVVRLLGISLGAWV